MRNYQTFAIGTCILETNPWCSTRFASLDVEFKAADRLGEGLPVVLLVLLFETMAVII